jgi:hypothetical protein
MALSKLFPLCTSGDGDLCLELILLLLKLKLLRHEALSGLLLKSHSVLVQLGLYLTLSTHHLQLSCKTPLFAFLLTPIGASLGISGLCHHAHELLAATHITRVATATPTTPTTLQGHELCVHVRSKWRLKTH